jgi:hypothetical protein
LEEIDFLTSSSIDFIKKPQQTLRFFNEIKFCSILEWNFLVLSFAEQLEYPLLYQSEQLIRVCSETKKPVISIDTDTIMRKYCKVNKRKY